MCPRTAPPRRSRCRRCAGPGCPPRRGSRTAARAPPRRSARCRRARCRSGAVPEASPRRDRDRRTSAGWYPARARRPVVGEPGQDHRCLCGGPPSGEAHAEVVERLEQRLDPGVQLGLALAQVEVVTQRVGAPGRWRPTGEPQPAQRLPGEYPTMLIGPPMALRRERSAAGVGPEQAGRRRRRRPAPTGTVEPHWPGDADADRVVWRNAAAEDLRDAFADALPPACGSCTAPPSSV